MRKAGPQKRRFWSGADLELLRSLYPSVPTREIAARLNRTIFQVYNKAATAGLAKSPEYLQDPKNRCRLFPGHKFGKSGQFPKGNIPANKGLRRPGWSPGRMGEPQFKKGSRTGMAAKNWRPIGTILADTEGYLRIKVRDAIHGKEPTGFGNTKVWPLLNRHVWEQHNGPIPPKHIVAFKDRNRANCSIENLELISMAENANRNRMWNRLPRELAEAIQLNGALKRRLRRLNGEK